ncbi:mannonate dehydratase, partial [Abyssibius alkaniclasticus]|uniref:mannonate dehydratase n=1 Tax=Abyssibius alkaniclasticus TaxID=2881234 RepID=UPI004058EBA9
MKETWRWFGPLDALGLDEVAQTGAAGIVNALHEVPYGEVWQSADIAARRHLIESAGFDWDVVESLPIHEAIKRGDAPLEPLFANYRQSMANLAENGIRTICYNFMPVLDWTRTDLAWKRPSGATCMRFDFIDFAAFDIHILQRSGAAEDFPDEIRDEAARRYAEMDDPRREQL